MANMRLDELRRMWATCDPAVGDLDGEWEIYFLWPKFRMHNVKRIRRPSAEELDVFYGAADTGENYLFGRIRWGHFWVARGICSSPEYTTLNYCNARWPFSVIVDRIRSFSKWLKLGQFRLRVFNREILIGYFLMVRRGDCEEGVVKM